MEISCVYSASYLATYLAAYSAVRTVRLCIVFGIECCFVCDILFQFGTLCMKAEEHLWAGVVGGFHAKCTELE